MTNLLKRQSVMTHVVPDELYSFARLMDEAKNLLSYTTSEFDLLAPKYVWPREKPSPPLPLCQALAKLGISPFVPETVIEYKRKKLRNLRIRACLRIFGRHLVWIFLSIFMGFLVPAVLEILFNGQQMPSPFNWFLILSTFPLSACLVARWLCRDLPDGFLWVAWNLIPINEYRRPIPEFALYSAVELKKLCPEADFYIDALSVVDPFLVVQYKGEYYWIEVWNEHEFK